MRAEKPLTLGDRLDYACIAAFAGLVVGACAALATLFLLGSSSWGIVAFSLVYFFAIGFVRGPDAGDLAGDALSILAGDGAGSTEIEGARGRLPLALIVGYTAGVVLLALFL